MEQHHSLSHVADPRCKLPDSYSPDYLPVPSKLVGPKKSRPTVHVWHAQPAATGVTTKLRSMLPGSRPAITPSRYHHTITSIGARTRTTFLAMQRIFTSSSAQPFPSAAHESIHDSMPLLQEPQPTPEDSDYDASSESSARTSQHKPRRIQPRAAVALLDSTHTSPPQAAQTRAPARPGQNIVQGMWRFDEPWAPMNLRTITPEDKSAAADRGALLRFQMEQASRLGESVGGDREARRAWQRRAAEGMAMKDIC